MTAGFYGPNAFFPSQKAVNDVVVGTLNPVVVAETDLAAAVGRVVISQVFKKAAEADRVVVCERRTVKKAGDVRYIIQIRVTEEGSQSTLRTIAVRALTSVIGGLAAGALCAAGMIACYYFQQNNYPQSSGCY